MRVIGMLLGIPEEDQVAVRDKTDADLRTRPGQPMKVREGTVANGDMFADYIEWRAHASLRRPDDSAPARRVRGRERREADAHTGRRCSPTRPSSLAPATRPPVG